ncbi:MAG TPA: response regulator [Candidatus Polarisedimenticolaceae bacterium]|nr:response regulator [Candidatus Polarisedimenticolaceae bacterium]
MSHAPLRTVVVDSSESFVAVTEKWLARRSEVIVVGHAYSGAEARKAVDRLNPELIVLDATLPGIEGFRLVLEWKARTAAPRVVLSMSDASDAARRAAFAAGADAFLRKEAFAAEMDLLLRSL